MVPGASIVTGPIRIGAGCRELGRVIGWTKKRRIAKPGHALREADMASISAQESATVGNINNSKGMLTTHLQKCKERESISQQVFQPKLFEPA
jgi:hypothetical protein